MEVIKNIIVKYFYLTKKNRKILSVVKETTQKKKVM